MSTWIVWPPDTREQKFPQDFQNGDPLERFEGGVQVENCAECGFQVFWISDKEQFEAYDEETRQMIRSLLKRQLINGDCPNHPKPNWLA